jgi:hypothetical protein
VSVGELSLGQTFEFLAAWPRWRSLVPSVALAKVPSAPTLRAPKLVR